MPPEEKEIDEEILEEGSYYLSRMGLTNEQIAAQFETTPARVTSMIDSYSTKLQSHKITPAEIDFVFWEDVKKEAEGDVKLTFLSEKGFHHAWKSELGRLDGPALMSIYEASKDFLSADPNQKFLDYPPPKGYDPLAMDRELRKAVKILEELISEKWIRENGNGGGTAANT